LRARGRQFQVHDAFEALSVSERRYRTLAEALPQLVWTSQPDGQHDYFSKQWVEYTGIPKKEQFGLAWLDKVVHPEDRATGSGPAGWRQLEDRMSTTRSSGFVELMASTAGSRRARRQSVTATGSSDGLELALT
jgi:PAS domain-containing protein